MSIFQGQRVSTGWGIILRAAARSGVRFTINDGQRSMRDQQRLVAEKGVYNAITNPHGAAVPNPTAPHIKAGHQNHALDVSTLDGGEDRLQNWCRAQGLILVNNVSTEPWHLDPTDEANFLRVAAKLKPPTKRERLKRELAHLRSWVRKNRGGHWSKAPLRKRRADAIERWLKKHRR